MIPLGGTILITGAGSVENAWKPINRALGFQEDDNISANIYFSTIVHELRNYSLLIGPNQKDPNLKVVFQTQYSLLFEKYTSTKKKIAIELKQSVESSELSLRKEFEHLVKEHCGNNPNIITTNWDDLIQTYAFSNWGEGNFVNFLHGTYALIGTHLPGEKYNEPYNSLLFPSEHHFEPYFPHTTKAHLSTSNFIAGGFLNFTNKIILYGISLSPLDAELNCLIGKAIRNSSPEIVIIDPDYKTISLRIKAILKGIGEPESKLDNKITGINPI